MAGGTDAATSEARSLLRFLSIHPMASGNEHPSWLDRSIASLIPRFNVETLIIVVILVLAVFSRFYMLGARVMSHDETNHVVPSWELYQGQGYRHDPITHGPLQFHLIALTFFMFGDNDFTARVPAALLSVVAVAFVLFAFRRYLGRTGALVAGLLFLISPYMMFYGRYTRNEPFIEFFAPLMLYATLAYLEKGQKRFLYLSTVAWVLHFIAKETAYIYAAEMLLFLGFLFLERITRRTWSNPAFLRPFILALIAAVLLVGGGLGLSLFKHAPAGAVSGPNAVVTPATPGGAVGVAGEQQLLPLLLLAIGVATLIAAVYFLVRGVGLAELHRERSLDLLILLGTLMLPLLAALPVKMIGRNPLDYSPSGILITGVILGVLAAVAIAVGWFWQGSFWLSNAAIFYAVFTVFYTTFFTNGMGFFTGMVGSLGYWLSQQSVNRGSQPLYYFALIQIPMYEFLGATGTLLAIYYGWRKKLTNPAQAALALQDASAGPSWAQADPGDPPEAMIPAAEKPADETEIEEEAPAAERPEPPPLEPTPVFALLVFWSIASLVSFSVAGEKMPWLTVHIAIPLLLLAGWGLGTLIERIEWGELRARRGWLVILLLPVFFTSLAGTLASLLGPNPPFSGNELNQLQATSTFFTSVVVLALTSYGLVRLLKDYPLGMARRLFALTFFAILAVLTARTAIRASFINYDTAKEFLVYAHAARGPKDVLAQVEEISQRTTGGLDIAVAYDNNTLYPFWWYFRNFPNKVYYADNPTRELRNDPIILVGEENYGKIAAIVGNAYDEFDYTRLWWPMQDYFNLNWSRIFYAITNPGERNAVWQIWFNADYSNYAKVNNINSLTLTTWQPSDHMRMYIRKDIVAKMWNYGVGPSAAQAITDPYEKGTINLTADLVVGAPGTGSGQFNSPRGIAVAPDGSLYVADSKNNRIVHLSADGKVIQEWGSFADVSKGPAPGGTFNEPWDVAVGPDGSVYVADTWNNRIQKFSADGKFIKMWGYFGTAEAPTAFWGPRGIAVNAKGDVFVDDTGNKRVVIFDADGNYIGQFGGGGSQPGQLDEPVGIAFDSSGNVYVADTWNQRVQVFAPDASGTKFTPLTSWDISGWFGQSLENKPFIAVDAQDHVFVTDPEAARVLEFDDKGTFIRAWGEPGQTQTGFGIASGIAVDQQGRVWVSDGQYSRLLRFTLP